MRAEAATLEVTRSPARGLAALVYVGAATAVLGIVIAPERIWPILLLVCFYLVGLGLSGVLIIAIQYVSGGGWHTVIRRVPEAISAILPYASIALVLVLVSRMSMYSWYGHSFEEETYWFKDWWLSAPFFLARALFYIAVWFLFARAIVGTSRRQDADGALSHTARNRRLSGGFIFVFALTFSLASFDWIMSLEPEWYSTMFGVYNFSGLILSGLAAINLVVIRLVRTGQLRGIVNKSHLHDMGGLTFAFSCFWGYIWFSQFMLIWYSNIPEETTYFISRIEGGWGPLFLLNLVLNWVVPFLALLPRYAKEDLSRLALVSWVILVGRWLDLYLMILPASAGAAPAFGLWEVGVTLGGFGIFGLIFFRALSKAPLLPKNDPYFEESLHHHR